MFDDEIQKFYDYDLRSYQRGYYFNLFRYHSCS